MKLRKIVIIIFVLIVLYVSGWFAYTRFCLDKYIMNGNTLKYKNVIYEIKETTTASDEENLGKTIGIGIMGKRTITDLIWPFWVIEYKNDREHNQIYVRGLMGSGGVYSKAAEN